MKGLGLTNTRGYAAINILKDYIGVNPERAISNGFKMSWSQYFGSKKRALMLLEELNKRLSRMGSVIAIASRDEDAIASQLSSTHITTVNDEEDAIIAVNELKETLAYDTEITIHTKHELKESALALQDFARATDLDPVKILTVSNLLKTYINILN